MELETLKDLYVHEVKDLYSVANQLIKALPKMAKAATNRRTGLTNIFRRLNSMQNASNIY